LNAKYRVCRFPLLDLRNFQLYSDNPLFSAYTGQKSKKEEGEQGMKIEVEDENAQTAAEAEEDEKDAHAKADAEAAVTEEKGGKKDKKSGKGKNKKSPSPTAKDKQEKEEVGSSQETASSLIPSSSVQNSSQLVSIHHTPFLVGNRVRFVLEDNMEVSVCLSTRVRGFTTVCVFRFYSFLA
jgi:hypothetical protein